jgi:pimeloyl-ACP methyl ester carboxylesterase
MARCILVHGAFSGAWAWEPVVAPLAALGHDVETLDLPGSGDDRTPVAEVTLELYVDRVRALLESSPEPAVLVGASMGGVVITQVAADAPERVVSLVFVCAFMPADRQSLSDLTHYPEGANDMIQANMVVEGSPPTARLPDDAAREAVYNLCTDEQAARAIARRRPQPLAPFGAPVRVGAGLDAVPRSYVLTRHDRSIPVALQRRMIREHHCERVIELEADHAPMLSATDDLVAALDSLAAVGEP